jgi:hypothetical protein
MAKILLYVVIIVIILIFIRYRKKEHFISEMIEEPLPIFPIDVVYTWVDGSDEEWIKQKNKYYSNKTLFSKLSPNNSNARWRDLNTLKYSLRSIEMYAPWIRNVYIVTCCGQVPDFIKQNDRLRIIDHKQIMPSSALPTFQSVAIESCIHKIPGLSEHFIYFNDDVLLGSPTEPSDFFYSVESVIYPKYFREKNRINFNSTPFTKLLKHTNSVLNSIHKEYDRYMTIHAPFPLRISLINEKQRQFRKEFDTTINSKFRNENILYDLTLFNHYWCEYNNVGRQGVLTNVYMRVNSNMDKVFVKIRKNSPKTICINDVEDTVEDNDRIRLEDFLEEQYPVKSSYEN